MRIGFRPKWWGVLACAASFLPLTVTTAAADDKSLEELKARLERLEKQNEELRNKLEEVAPSRGPYKAADGHGKDKVKQLVDDYLKEKDKKKKQDDEKKKQDDEAKKLAKEAEGYKVGSDLGLTVRWNPEQGLLFESKNKDFVSHIGYFMQWDTVSWTQNPNLRPLTQIGDLQDGTYFRRIRPLWDGRAWDFVEWNVILALEQVQGSAVNGASNINLDEVWAGVYGIPIIGRIRAGHLKINQGLEGNQWSSSRCMTFMENAAYTDAFYNIFGTGIQTCNSWLDDGRNGDRVTAQAAFYWQDNPLTNTGNIFGDGDNYAATGRVTALVIDECQDRHFLHLGLSATWRKDQRFGLANVALGGLENDRFRARPELRDAIGGFGDLSALPGNTSRLVDTGPITGGSNSVIGTELWYNLGPFNVMAEYAFATLYGAGVPVTERGRTRTVTGDRNFNGGYVTVSYFLTGESQAYDHTFGRRAFTYIKRPFTNAWIKRDENGGLTTGWGAWELAARYSYLNLNDGPIQGGVMNGVTLGVNWYLNTNFKLQFEWVHDARWDKGTAPFGTVPGSVDGFGTRMMIQF
jgi:phosphate-selective porin OprO/OprP